MEIWEAPINKMWSLIKFIEAYITRYHVLKEDWTPQLGDKLDAVRELSNTMEKFHFSVGLVKTESESLGQLRFWEVIAGSGSD